MYCNKCGKEIPNDSIYCNFCGNKIEVINKEKIDNKASIDESKIENVEKKQAPTHSQSSNQNANNQQNSVLNSSLSKVPYKRPISVVLVVLLGTSFFLNFMILLAIKNPELAIVIYFPIFIIISFSLIFVNLGKNKNRMFGFLIATCVMIAILVSASISYSFKLKNSQADSVTQDTSQAELNTDVIIEESGSTTPSVNENSTQLQETNNQIGKPIILTGNGNKSTDFFNIAGGYTFLDFNCSSFFKPINLDVMDSNGNKVQNINTIISSSFYEMLYAPEGKYFLNIEAEGPWKTIITQYSPSSKNLPYTFIGSSKNLSDFIVIDGLVEIQYNYSGSEYLSVDLLDEFGSTITNIVSEEGSNTRSGSTSFKGDGSKYLISVKSADGYYKIEVSYK
jgi:uncharacterized membrane protein YqjE